MVVIIYQTSLKIKLVVRVQNFCLIYISEDMCEMHITVRSTNYEMLNVWAIMARDIATQIVRQGLKTLSSAKREKSLGLSQTSTQHMHTPS